MTAAAQLLDAIVPLVRTRLPRGVDVDYLDDFLARNRFALEAVIEQNLGPVLALMQAANRSLVPAEDIPEFWTASKRTAANIPRWRWRRRSMRSAASRVPTSARPSPGTPAGVGRFLN